MNSFVPLHWDLNALLNINEDDFSTECLGSFHIELFIYRYEVLVRTFRMKYYRIASSLLIAKVSNSEKLFGIVFRMNKGAFVFQFYVAEYMP